MKETLLKFFKIFLIIAAVLIVLLLIFGLVLRMEWPWWVGLFLVLVLLGLGIGLLFLRKIWLRRREQLFVQQVIEQDESQLKNLAAKEKDEMKELQERWKEAIEALRKSHLRKQGNPLYVLPWYLVMGESGSGKTTSINSAHLSSPFVEVRRTAGISGTRNCDWWFFEQAILLDTAGRYAIPVDEGRDKEEWQKFLQLLVKYRKKEPLHGLIVTIAADKLMQSAPEPLEQDGKNIRRRIDELMRVLGAKFPVYILVTKCDLVQGMIQFCDQLPEKSLDQPLGYINQELATDVAAFQDRAFHSIGERLRNLRIQLLHGLAPKKIDPGLLLFPEEFENLKRGLEPFMRAAFQENPYQETPILRGLFFSSGRQEGSPYSHFLRALGLIAEKEVLPGTSKGLFLHDFFSKILPKDRGIFTPTRRALEWRTLTRNLGLASWVVLGVAVCGLLSFSFVYNLNLLREVSQNAKLPSLQGEILADLDSMDRYRQAILNLETQKRKWWIPRMGLDISDNIEIGLKNKYCNQFQSRFLDPFDQQMAGVMAQFTPSTPDDIIGEYIAHLIRRIHLVKARLGGENFEALQKKPQPSAIFLQSKADPGIEPEVRKKFSPLYLYYLIWRLDSAAITKEMNPLQVRLKHLLALKGSNLRWLVFWVDKQSALPSVTRKDFWGGSADTPDEKTIPPAFTRKGRELIDSFAKEMESALPEPAALGKPKAEFEQWYRNACFETWQNFAATFPRGIERLKGIKEWQYMAGQMATEKSPYFALLNKMSWELEPLVKGENLPSWLSLVYQYQAAKAQGAAEGLLKDKGMGAKLIQEGKKIVAAGKKAGKDTEDLEAKMAAAKAVKEYQTALNAITPASTSRNQAYQMASQAYSEDPATSKSPLFTAHGAMARFKSALKARPGDEMFWKLFSGPLDYLWTFVRAEASCYLQSQWEEKVLAETQGIEGPQAQQALLGPEGLAWKFIKGPAAPFVTRSLQRGYYPKEALGGKIPFEASFLTYLAKGAQATTLAKKSYPVAIVGLPTAANPDARVKPHSTRLEMQCAGQATSLLNQNFRVSKTFSWSPDSCGDVSLQIEVGDIVLKKKYSGDQAFPEFLHEFRTGQHTFYPKDFPDEKAALERIGIKYILVNYEFSGQQAVLGQVGSIPRQAPQKIVKCWEK